jgi:hypothetical protein
MYHPGSSSGNIHTLFGAVGNHEASPAKYNRFLPDTKSHLPRIACHGNGAARPVESLEHEALNNATACRLNGSVANSKNLELYKLKRQEICITSKSIKIGNFAICDRPQRRAR